MSKELKNDISEELEYEIAEDLYENFKEITGYERKDVVDPELGMKWDEFDSEIVEETEPLLDKYIKEKYNVDPEKTQIMLNLNDLLMGYSL